MRLLIIADAFPPMRTSAAVHMNELAIELIEQFHEVTVLVPAPLNNESFSIINTNGFRTILIRTPKVKDIGYIRRTIAEFVSPYIMYYWIKRSEIFNEKFDGIVWYSPSIFFGYLIFKLKKAFNCKTYLILRDIFPDWAIDLGLMKKRLPYYLLKMVEFYQYQVADCIGVQAPGNLKYFESVPLRIFRSKVELLWTWVKPALVTRKCSIDLKNTHLKDKIIFVYSGNMGVAQDFDLIFELIELFNRNDGVGFLFVGRGSELSRLRHKAEALSLFNVLFFDEIDPIEIPSLYSQCHVGIVALDPRHKSHNIPGKFLSYMSAGLPVLARLNMNNDLIKIIDENNVGASYCGDNPIQFKFIADSMLAKINKNNLYSVNCKKLAKNIFSSEKAVQQIIKALS